MTLVVDIVGAAEVVDTGGLQAAASLDRAGFDVAASGLSTAASALGCDVVELNAMVDDGLVGLATGGPFSAMVRNMLTAQDFFVAG